MSYYEKLNYNLKLAKGAAVFNQRAQESDNNKLKTYDKLRLGKILYEEGFAWFKAGKDLNDAIEIVIFDGKEIQKREQISFKQGYFKGIFELGYKLGYDNYTIDELPIEYINYIQFLNGYKKGIEDKANMSKKNGQRKR